MSSLVTNLNSLTVIGSAIQEIVNWVTTADGLRTHRRRDSTRQLSRVGVGGVYWPLHCHSLPVNVDDAACRRENGMF